MVKRNAAFRRVVVFCAAGVALGPWSVARLTAAEAAPEAQIERLEGERFAAMRAADADALERILAPDLTYVHSNAKLDTKKELIEAIKTGALKYNAIAPEDVRVRVYGSTAVVTGLCRFDVGAVGQELKLQVRYTDVYVKRDGVWQLSAWQSTRLP